VAEARYTAVDLEKRAEYNRISREPRNGRSESEHQNVWSSPFVRRNPNLSLWKLERVKRSESNSSFDFCQRLQLLTPSVYFLVGRIVGRFVRRSTWLACHSKLVLPLWKSVKNWSYRWLQFFDVDAESVLHREIRLPTPRSEATACAATRVTSRNQPQQPFCVSNNDKLLAS